MRKNYNKEEKIIEYLGGYVHQELLKELVEYYESVDITQTKLRHSLSKYLDNKFPETILNKKTGKGMPAFWIRRGFSYEEYEPLRKEYAKSCYASNNVEYRMKKYNISKEEAKRQIEEFGKKGVATLRSRMTKEEISEMHRKHGMSLEALQAKHGIEEGRRIYEAKRKKHIGAFSLEWYIERYGDVKGRDEFSKRQKNVSRRLSLERFIELYGLEEGYRRHEEFKRKNSHSRTLEGYIEKYGVEEGTSRFNVRQERWQTALNNKPQEELDRINDARYRALLNIGMVSKESKKFFIKIYKHVRKYVGREDVLWGINGSEEFRINYDGKRSYYDFTIIPLKIIIEYHGVAWHPKSPDDKEYVKLNPVDVTAEKKYTKDQMKMNAALALGYKYFVVWSDDNLIEKQKELINEIDKIYHARISG